MSTEVRCVLSAGDGVGESLSWCSADNTLIWVDIIGKRLHRLEPTSGRHDVFALGTMPTSVALRRGGGLVLGLLKSVELFDDGRMERLADIEPDRPDTRLNEGAVAPDGSYWVGTMENNLHPDGTLRETGDAPHGQLYRIAPDGAVSLLTDDKFGITNTMVWLSPERFVTADTAANTLYAYRSDGEQLTDRKVFAGPHERGFPDGSCFDAQGYVWNARFGGSAVIRFSPDGRVDRVVDLPFTNPTSCAFGGPDRDVLYITSARFTLSEARISEAPDEGGLFACHVGVRGADDPAFSG